MFAFAALCLTLLFSAVLGSPLTQRDVFNPHITNPHQGTVWTVGSQETVTCVARNRETDDIPPDSQLTNPNGRVILGFLENNSLNLQLDTPLAENFKLRIGQVNITVPDVPPREDYIIVLMGDSGNASPAFAITSIKGGSSSSSSRPASGTPSTSGGTGSAAPTSTDNSPPFTGGAITGGSSGASTSATPVGDNSSSASAPQPTSTAPVSLSLTLSVLPGDPGSTTSSGSATVAGTAVGAAATSTSAAWTVHSFKLWSFIAAPMALSLLMI